MPQQINLFTPILLTQKRYFSAQTLVQALAALVFFGGVICAYWVWSLNSAGKALQKPLLEQSRELASLQLAIQQSKTLASAVPAQLAFKQELQARNDELLEREKLLKELERGLFQPGWGHAARLQLVAKSIPAQAWVTELTADDSRLAVSGFTLEPAALNGWVDKLAASPLLKGQKLTNVKVENATASSAPAPAPASASASAPASASASASASAKSQPVWAFSLVSAIKKSSVVSESNP